MPILMGLGSGGGLGSGSRMGLGSGGSGVALGSEYDGKVSLLVTLSKNLTGRVNAGRLVRGLAGADRRRLNLLC